MITPKIIRKIFLKIKDILFRMGFNQKKDVLIYLGVNKGQGFNTLFRNYKVSYGFEANPDLYKTLKETYKKYKNVHIINAAVAREDGYIEFNISNNSVSSSIGTINKNWGNEEIKMIKKVKVPSINLFNFLQKNNIEYIDDYHSDIQGYDLEVLKTLKPFIDKKRIGTITSEVAKDKHKNIYSDLPDNNESAFNKLLKNNYTLVAKGEGILKEGTFNSVPEDWWEMDCMWKIKN